MNTNAQPHVEDHRHWICCQIGAREHYAIPRALIGQGRGVHLLTDVWATPANRWILPEQWKQRSHDEIPDSRVNAWTGESIFRSVRSRITGRKGWTEIIERNKWFQKRACVALDRLCRQLSKPPVVFGYSYAAGEIFRLAQSRGCTTILGQMDPALVEVRLVQEIERKHGQGQSEWPPESYWLDWQQECQSSDHIVVNSEWSRRALLEQGVDEQKLEVISLAYEKCIEAGPGSVPDKFDTDRPLRVLFLGQVIPRKGVVELADAAGRLEKEPVEWRVVGGGPPEILERLGQMGNVTVTGPISRSAVKQEYERADVFILPTHSDGFALTQLEAAAYGLPIIASEFCGDVVDDGKNGLILKEVTAAAIAEAVSALVSSPEFVNRLRNDQVSRKLFDLRTLGQTLIQLAGRSNKGGTTPCST